MQQNMIGKRGILALTLLCGSFAFATDYYVSTTGADANDGLTAETAFETIDKAIGTATAKDTIYVASGTYQTTTQWGPNLVATMVGMGDSRDDVIIESAGSYRTLRTASTGVIKHLTIVGNKEWVADKGGAVEMSGGTIEDCVIKDGTAKANGNVAGGNLYMNGGTVSNCEISGGQAKQRGGNLYIENGTVVNCTIKDGSCSNVGGNIFGVNGLVSKCTISGGTAVNDGGSLRLYNGKIQIADCVIRDGTITSDASQSKKGANVYMDGSTRLTRCHLIGGSHTGGYNAGSLCIYSSSVQVEDCLIEQSKCGGILLGGTSYIYNTTVVKNEKYGVWSWNEVQHLYNLAIYGNTDGGAAKDWAGNVPKAAENFQGCAAHYDSSVAKSSKLSVVSLPDASCFVDYDNGDYRPVKNSVLVDVGVPDPRADASELDLSGKPRVVDLVDIGCYEYQSESFTVTFSMAYATTDHAPAAVNFTAVPLNAEGEVTYTYDFGDGSVPETTTEAVYTHTYATNGLYTVSLTAVAAGNGETSSLTREEYVPVYGDIVWVNPSATPKIPYNTRETGVTSINAALDVHAPVGGGTVCLAPAVYTTSWQFGLNAAYVVRGMGATPEDVIIRNTATANSSYNYRRVFEVTSDGARIENLTMEGGQVYNNRGGNLRMTAGVVSNCVIRGGLATASTDGNATGGAAELAGTSVLTHCWITNNVLVGASKDATYRGGAAVYMNQNQKDMKLSNCLIAYNRYEPGETIAEGTAGVLFGGSNEQVKMENCSVVSNLVVGTLTDDSAACYCTSWSTTFRNCVFAGNYETGKDKFTTVKFDSHVSVAYCVMDDVAANKYCTLGDVKTMFKDFDKGNFMPKPGSVLANKGTSSLTLSCEVDLAGKPRVFGKAIDIGSFEAQQNSGLIITIR